MSVAWSQALLVSEGRNEPLGRLQGKVWAEARRTERVILPRVHKAHFLFVDGMFEPDDSRLLSFLTFFFFLVHVSTFFLPFSLFLSLNIFSSFLTRYEFPSLRYGVSLWVGETLRGRFEVAF